MAKKSKPQSRYKLHNAKLKTFGLASQDPYSSPCDVEVVRGSFRIKSKPRKIFRDGMSENKESHRRQNGNQNNRPLKVPY